MPLPPNAAKHPSSVSVIVRTRLPATSTEAFLPHWEWDHVLNPNYARWGHPDTLMGPPGVTLLHLDPAERGFGWAVALTLTVGLGWVEACARMHNRLMHALNGNTAQLTLVKDFDIFSSGGGWEGQKSQILTLALSMVPPVPEAVKNFVANTPFASTHPSWHTYTMNIPQMVTALVLIEQSNAGRVWGVKLADIPMETQLQGADTKYKNPGGIAELGISVAWFFKKSGLSDASPMASVNWADQNASQSRGSYSSYPGNKANCDAIARMIYAAQGWTPEQVEDPGSTRRLAAVEGQVTAMEARIAALESQNSSLMNRLKGAPAATCLMLLFTQGHGQTQLDTYTDIPPHTERISDLSDDAEDWLRQQLKTRNLWIKVVSMDSAEENHISWAPLEGGTEIGAAVIRKYGAYRFW